MQAGTHKVPAFLCAMLPLLFCILEKDYYLCTMKGP